MKCPKCGCKDIQATNMGKRITATIIGIGGGLLTGLFNRGLAGPQANKIRQNICPERKYICLNPSCKHMFSEPN